MRVHTPLTPANGEPGEVVLASVHQPLQDPGSSGKRRPVVLVRRDGGRWWVMGLTTLPIYGDGTSRTPVPDPAAVGLDRDGYLWGDRLTAVSALDVELHLGWVDEHLADTVIAQARLSRRDAAAVRGLVVAP